MLEFSTKLAVGLALLVKTRFELGELFFVVVGG